MATPSHRPGLQRPLFRLKPAKAPHAMGVQPLSPSRGLVCAEAQGVLCPGPVLLPWDHCSGLGGLQAAEWDGGRKVPGMGHRLGCVCPEQAPHHHTQALERGQLPLEAFKVTQGGGQAPYLSLPPHVCTQGSPEAHLL